MSTVNCSVLFRTFLLDFPTFSLIYATVNFKFYLAPAVLYPEIFWEYWSVVNL